MSAIAVSDSKISGGGEAAGGGVTRFGGGVCLQPGLEAEVVFAVYAKTIFNLFTPSAGPLRQIKKSSQPFFFSRTDGVGASGCVDMATWFAFLFFWHDMLSWPGPSPQPCVEQNLDTEPVIQLPQIAACS